MSIDQKDIEAAKQQPLLTPRPRVGHGGKTEREGDRQNPNRKATKIAMTLLAMTLLTACSDQAAALPTAQACISFMDGKNPLLKPIQSRVVIEGTTQVVIEKHQHTYCKDIPVGDYTLIWQEMGNPEMSHNFTMRSSGINVVINLANLR